MKTIIAFCLLAFAILPLPGQEPAPRTGVLLLAHGGSERWNGDVRHVADQVNASMPTEVAFGMATRATMQAAIDKLVARNVKEIVAVPLFVSSHSSVIESTAYLLGLRTTMPDDLKMFAGMHHGDMSHDMSPDAMSHDPEEGMKPVKSSVPIRMTPALDHHPVVASILTSRAAMVSQNPSSEVLVLVAHGPVPDSDNKLWLDDMNLLAGEMRGHTSYAGIECLTLRDDADDPVRSNATNELRATVRKIDDGRQTAIVVPLLLSYGGIEGGLRKRLDGLPYKMPTQGLLPDDRLVEWVIESVQHAPVI